MNTIIVQLEEQQGMHASPYVDMLY